MPSPIAHLAAGALIARKCGKGSAAAILLVSLFFSMAPDLDAIPGFIGGDLARFHNNLTHSPVFALLVTAVATPVVWFVTGRKLTLVATSLLVGGCYALHIVMDWLTWGRGVMLAWPFSDDRYMAPVELFYGLRWSNGVWASSHLITAVNEILVMAIVWLLAVRTPWLRSGR